AALGADRQLRVAFAVAPAGAARDDRGDRHDLDLCPVGLGTRRDHAERLRHRIRFHRVPRAAADADPGDLTAGSSFLNCVKHPLPQPDPVPLVHISLVPLYRLMYGLASLITTATATTRPTVISVRSIASPLLPIGPAENFLYRADRVRPRRLDRAGQPHARTH